MDTPNETSANLITDYFYLAMLIFSGQFLQMYCSYTLFRDIYNIGFLEVEWQAYIVGIFFFILGFNNFKTTALIFFKKIFSKKV
jgi:hypothetical protein